MISVVITAYNRYQSLKKAVEKVMAQTYKDIEIIVSDDCSKDDTPKIAEDYPQVKYFRTPKNLGYMGNSVHGLEKATGDYVIFLADDDLLVDDTFFEKSAEALKECDAVFGRCRTVCGEHVNYTRYPFKPRYSGQEFIDELMKLNFSFLDYFSLSSFIFDTEKLRKTKPFESLFPESTSVDIATIVKFALDSDANVGFVDVPAYEWKKSSEDSISGQKKNDMVYQCIQSVSAGIDIHRYFGGKDVCLPACNAYIEYIFNAILSDYHQVDMQKHFSMLIKDLKSKEIYIYGMGWAGRELASFVKENGITVKGFIDDIKSCDESAMSFDDFKEIRGEKHVVIANYKEKAVLSMFKRLLPVSNVFIYDLISYL